MNLDDTRVDRTRLYETRPGTWIAGAVVGVLLSLGLVVAGDRYVQAARGTGAQPGPDGALHASCRRSPNRPS